VKRVLKDMSFARNDGMGIAGLSADAHAVCVPKPHPAIIRFTSEIPCYCAGTPAPEK